MNYEELLVAKAGGILNRSQLSIGEFIRAKADGKYRSMVDIRQSLLDNITFCEALKSECSENVSIADNRQLHFTPVTRNDDIVRLDIAETGHLMSYSQMLEERPAVVGQPKFLYNVLVELVGITMYLHKRGIRHVCYSPRTIFVRKDNYTPLLLSHGSFYQSISNLEEFYGEDSAYVAPEVLNHGTIDDRCDVYSIGKFLQELASVSEMPVSFRKVIRKSVSESPEDRYDTPEDMLNAVRTYHHLVRLLVSGCICAIIALLCVSLYFNLYPEPDPVEFVKPVPRQPTDDLLDDGFDPAELGVTNSGDSLIYDEASERDYNAKAEEIFRKKYTEEAERILSKIYNKEYMSNAEKKFTSESQSTINELMKRQAELGDEAGLTPERSQLIATEIIERITDHKKKEMGGTNSRAIQK